MKNHPLHNLWVRRGIINACFLDVHPPSRVIGVSIMHFLNRAILSYLILRC
jgi:hypothetical protein